MVMFIHADPMPPSESTTVTPMVSVKLVPVAKDGKLEVVSCPTGERAAMLTRAPLGVRYQNWYVLMMAPSPATQPVLESASSPVSALTKLALAVMLPPDGLLWTMKDTLPRPCGRPGADTRHTAVTESPDTQKPAA
jgi:hypothetical protein